MNTADSQEDDNTKTASAAIEPKSPQERTPVTKKRTPQTNRKPAGTAVQQTPEQQKRSIDDSISGIKKILENPSYQELSEQDRIKEQQTWNRLLKTLEQERKNINKKPQPEPAKKASKDIPEPNKPQK